MVMLNGGDGLSNHSRLVMRLPVSRESYIHTRRTLFERTRLRWLLAGSLLTTLLFFGVGVVYLGVALQTGADWVSRDHALTFLLSGALVFCTWLSYYNHGFSWWTTALFWLGAYMPVLYGQISVDGHHERNLIFLLLAFIGATFSYRFFAILMATTLASWWLATWWAGYQPLDVWWYLYFAVIVPVVGAVTCRFRQRSLEFIADSQTNLKAQATELRATNAVLEAERLRRIKSEKKVAEQREEMVKIGRINELGEMVASIAHDINQPLHGILMHCGMLTAPGVDETLRLESVKQIERLAEHSASIIKRLQDHIEQDPLAIPFYVVDLVEQSMALTHDASKMHGVPVEQVIEDSSIMVNGPETHFTQVMVNLLRNAIQAVSDSGGSDAVVVTTQKHEKGLEVSVRDRGPGVKPNELESIFKAFYTTRKDGTGLGLAICRSILERHGCPFEATLNPEGGLTMSFVIPFKYLS